SCPDDGADDLRNRDARDLNLGAVHQHSAGRDVYNFTPKTKLGIQRPSQKHERRGASHPVKISWK
ncbi:MAG: hypothetical protein B6I38_11375, partial [Anaerolineaceae bacterium 4572_5.1]